MNSKSDTLLSGIHEFVEFAFQTMNSPFGKPLTNHELYQLSGLLVIQLLHITPPEVLDYMAKTPLPPCGIKDCRCHVYYESFPELMKLVRDWYLKAEAHKEKLVNEEEGGFSE